jgi:hypothetical protein
MGWRDPLDVYCERTDASFWSEPLNALTNAGFLIAAGDIRRRLGRSAPADIQWLTALLAMVGIGSFIFHTVAERWASVLDVAFIALFVLFFIHRALVHLFGWHSTRAAGAVLATLSLTALLATSVKIEALNGSELYLGPWAALIALAIACPAGEAKRWLGRAAILFMVSMTFRSIDMRLCASLPTGTHFLWHLNNALVLWCGLRGLVSGMARPDRAT